MGLVKFCPSGEIGRHKGLKIPRTLHVRAGSIPALGTKIKSPFTGDFIFFNCFLY